jgi:Protein phosphatase 2C
VVLIRVNGVLAVSRSFGDIMYKTFTPQFPPDSPTDGLSPVDFWFEGGGLWGPEQQVLSQPEVWVWVIASENIFVVVLFRCDVIQMLEIEVTPSFEFVVMASDGRSYLFLCVFSS